MKHLLCVALLFVTLKVSSQDNSYKHQLTLIDSLRQFITHDLKLNIKDNFYKQWTERTDSMYVFLYVSDSNRVKSPEWAKPVWFFDRRVDAEAKSKELKQKGYQTLVYQTAGTSTTELNRKLLSYPDEALAFIVIHEAVHQHIGMDIKYEFVESTCDAVANLACERFAVKTGLLNLKQVQKQKRIFEKAYAYLNLQRQLIDSAKGSTEKILEHCTKKINRLVQNANQFQKDRMSYEVNNAYFIRVAPYALRYFEVKKLLGGNFNTNNVIINATKH